MLTYFKFLYYLQVAKIKNLKFLLQKKDFLQKVLPNKERNYFKYKSVYRDNTD